MHDRIIVASTIRHSIQTNDDDAVVRIIKTIIINIHAVIIVIILLTLVELFCHRRRVDWQSDVSP